MDLEALENVPFNEINSENAESHAVGIRRIVLALSLHEADLSASYKTKKMEHKQTEAACTIVLKEGNPSWKVKFLDAQVLVAEDVVASHKAMIEAEREHKACKNLLETYQSVLQSVPAYIGRGSTLIKTTSGY